MSKNKSLDLVPSLIIDFNFSHGVLSLDNFVFLFVCDFSIASTTSDSVVLCDGVSFFLFL